MTASPTIPRTLIHKAKTTYSSGLGGGIGGKNTILMLPDDTTMMNPRTIRQLSPSKSESLQHPFHAMNDFLRLDIRLLTKTV